ncbi:MAG: hypothetical protein R3B48_27780 [Kofleriaceae bacterium]
MTRAGLSFALVVTVGLVAITAATARPEPPKAVTHEIAIRRFRYDPAELTVSPGDRVVWKNYDTVSHTATSDAAGPFDSGQLRQGGVWTWTVPAGAGDRPYHCTLHPNMKARLTIRPAP